DVVADVDGGSTQSEEPEPPASSGCTGAIRPNRSLWYSYRASDFEGLEISLSSAPAWINIYVGDSLSDLAFIGCTHNETTVGVRPGSVYHFQIAQDQVSYPVRLHVASLHTGSTTVSRRYVTALGVLDDPLAAACDNNPTGPSIGTLCFDVIAYGEAQLMIIDDIRIGQVEINTWFDDGAWEMSFCTTDDPGDAGRQRTRVIPPGARRFYVSIGNGSNCLNPGTKGTLIVSLR
ncbi:MAG TPA: hypothetical protein VI541_03170, partial [Actinomycetota bacterium]|nr:hypothetical protein [Actinomycetota bacterium]